MKSITRITTRLSLAFALLMTCGATSAIAADLVADIPSGWKVAPTWFAVGGNKVSVILHPIDFEPTIAGSKILTISTSGSAVCDIQGKAFYFQYSPDGSALLIHSNTQTTPIVASLNPLTCVTQWSKSPDTRLFKFCPDGTCVFARDVRSEWSAPGNVVEIFDLNGATIRRITLEHPPVGILPFAQGSRFLLALRRDLAFFKDEPTLVREWKTALPAPDQPVTGLVPLGPNLAMASQEYGHFRLVRPDGTSPYVFDPTALDAADPTRNFGDYASYQPSTTPLANKLLLFNGTEDALLLDVVTGALTGKRLSLTPVPGVKPFPMVSDGKLVFYSNVQVRVRSITF